MTLSEFKAWFEGYTEGLDGAPSEKQFKRIKAKVAEITGAPMTQTVFVDRYRDIYHHYWGHPVWYGLTGSGSFSSAGAVRGNGNVGRAAVLDANWDSHAAMYAVGKADAVAETA